jgi:uncharacterized membrane protein YccC
MATTRRTPKQTPSPTSADPIDRAREIAAEANGKRLTGRAHKQQREMYAAIMEEHIALLERSVPLGDIERAAHSVRRLGELITELKALEGWTWEYPRLTDPDRDLREKAAELITALAAAGEELRLSPPRPASLRGVVNVALSGEPTGHNAERITALKQTLHNDPDLARAVREVLHERGTEGLEPVPVVGTVE